MKRGFLNSSKAKARPLGPVIVSVPDTSKPAVSVQDVSPPPVRRFPIGKVAKTFPKSTSTSRNATIASEAPPDALTWTTLPLDAKADEPVTECFFFPGSKEVVMNTPGFPQPLVHPAQPSFRLADAPGMGMGLFSTRDLKMGDLILCERPLLISPRGVPTDPNPNFTDEMFVQYSMNMYEKCAAMAVDRMRPKDKAAFMALANCHTEDGSGPCSPNTDRVFDLPSLSFRLYAVRDIPAGEELTLSYVEVDVPTAERQESLKPYGFTCTCAACTDPSSDARRATIEASAPNVLMWATFDRTLPDDWVLKKALHQLKLHTNEKLEYLNGYSNATRAIMEAYICLGDTENASLWAAKVHRQVWAEEYKPAKLEALLDPGNIAAYEAHPYWRKRVDAVDLLAEALHALGQLAGPDNIKTLSGGGTLMMFDPLKMPGFPKFEPPK
ncbi:SET domain-containing protein [Mycena sanguinolenta]|uniref:SET domain-containing protein n=1 Tax=Mycena sanguinolenta TaxID=230812 RepID=A0A8H7D325_9AGAR|nr:SET domain-containing protein [Mycena sanguinolenta]